MKILLFLEMDESKNTFFFVRLCSVIVEERHKKISLPLIICK